MINNLQESLASALSELYSHFPNDIETLHEAVALVFSSIFRAFGIPCTIVGGQSAAYWMRMPGSRDVDFVSENCSSIAQILEKCSFVKSDSFHFRFKHPLSNVLIELVDEKIVIKGVKKVDKVEILPDDIQDPVVKSLMPGTAEILDPVSVFLNYVEASSNDSIWYNYQDNGALAIERACALFKLYQNVILTELATLLNDNNIEENLLRILHEKFHIKI